MKTLAVLASLALVAAGAFLLVSNNGEEATADSVLMEKREANYQKASEAISEAPEQHPASKDDLSEEFWTAVQTGDMETVLRLCPGSTKEDFAPFEHFKPTAYHGLGTPSPHPTVPDVMLYPAHLSFPGFPKKTIKLAFVEIEGGNLAIDGRHTIWW